MAFQVGSAFLDACVLAVLAREDTYGYILTQQMRKVVDISESTLYPVLRRLQKSEYLTTYDSPYQGRNRRYYHITKEGTEKFKEYRTEWIWHKSHVDELMFGPDGEASMEEDASQNETQDNIEETKEIEAVVCDETKDITNESGGGLDHE